jgi:serpin B
MKIDGKGVGATLMSGIIGLCCLALEIGDCQIANNEMAADKATEVEANNKLAVDLYVNLRDEGENISLAPLCLRESLAMLYTGAGGDTGKQIKDSLHFSRNFDPTSVAKLNHDLENIAIDDGVDYVNANCLWLQSSDSLDLSFLERARNQYNTVVELVDFFHDRPFVVSNMSAYLKQELPATVKPTIGIALKATGGMTFVNVSVFKGFLRTQETNAVFDGDFWVGGSQSVRCSLLKCTGEFHAFPYQGLYEAIELPFIGHDFSLVVVLPLVRDGQLTLQNGKYVGTPQGAALDEFERELANSGFSKMLRMLSKTSLRPMEVVLPRFSLLNTYDLAGPLRSIGITNALTDHDHMADFSRIDKSGKLALSLFLHQSVLKISGAVSLEPAHKRDAMVPSHRTGFRADHPFVFVIRDRRSGAILFVGRLMDPTQQ